MAEVGVKTKRKIGRFGDLKFVTYQLGDDTTQPANGQTVTAPFQHLHHAAGINITTADVPLGGSISGRTFTLIISSTTDKYIITLWGK